MGMSHRKIKNVAKIVQPKSEQLSAKVLAVMKLISDTVGATLGPGGCPVLIERQEYGFPNLVTKDGVTVFKALGFRDETAHAIMETARDASVRTATEAGDGTTTATVLAEAIVRWTHKFCSENPKVSPQKVVRTLEKLFANFIKPKITELAIKTDPNLLYAVAKCSANGDDELATAIMKCFDLTGDEGNITIDERSGPSGYAIDQLKGYPVGIGYDESCQRFFPGFINDKINARVYLEKPAFVLNFGTITEIQQLYGIVGTFGAKWEEWVNTQKGPQPVKNLVVVATGFSESVLGQFMRNFDDESTLNIVPLLIPKTIVQNGQLHFLEDLQAMTGSTIFDPIRKPLKHGTSDECGSPIEYFEMTRNRSNIVGIADEDALILRVEELKSQLDQGGYESEAERQILIERIAKLTGGIAKLTVIGPSNGEIREKKDRAEDAACAVRGAIKHGCLPGGGWTFIQLIDFLQKQDYADDLTFNVMNQVLCPSLLDPFLKLLDNCGYSADEVGGILNRLNLTIGSTTIYDALNAQFIDARDSGVMDSVPAVLEAVRNSISIASLLGTLGGVVLFPRDTELERQEAGETYEFLQNGNLKG